MMDEAVGRAGSGDVAIFPGQLLLIECTPRATPTKALDAEGTADPGGQRLRIPTAAARAPLMGANCQLDSQQALCE